MSNNNILYLSHGGGPLPLLGDSEHDDMVSTLKDLALKIVKPSAIIVISAHWEAKVATITSAATPDLVYDYFGFPEQAYDIRYPCSGAPELAKTLSEALNKSGITNHLDNRRGLDHGVFVPLKIMYPEADIPCVQLSLMNSLDAEHHLQMGQALQSLLQGNSSTKVSSNQNLLVIGSGFSFHNMKAFFAAGDAVIDAKNLAFQDWLKTTITSKELSESQRIQRLVNWQQAPNARVCHPREEHLLPPHICYGMAKRASDEDFRVEILGKTASMFLWNC
jgi:aromatic ring-opening dioxygenase catalytic subunit (LigB family)